MSSKALFVACITFLYAADGRAQHTRLMFMKNKNRIVYYEAGDVLTFIVKDHAYKISDQIGSFQGDSIIVFNHHLVDVRTITGVYLDKKNKVFYFMKYKYDKLLLFMGTGYLLLDVINTGEFDKKTLIISGSMIGAGLLAKLFISKRIKVTGKKKLRILNL